MKELKTVNFEKTVADINIGIGIPNTMVYALKTVMENDTIKTLYNCIQTTSADIQNISASVAVDDNTTRNILTTLFFLSFTLLGIGMSLRAKALRDKIIYKKMNNYQNQITNLKKQIKNAKQH